MVHSTSMPGNDDWVMVSAVEVWQTPRAILLRFPAGVVHWVPKSVIRQPDKAQARRGRVGSEQVSIRRWFYTSRG